MERWWWGATLECTTRTPASTSAPPISRCWGYTTTTATASGPPARCFPWNDGSTSSSTEYDWASTWHESDTTTSSSTSPYRSTATNTSYQSFKCCPSKSCQSKFSSNFTDEQPTTVQFVVLSTTTALKWQPTTASAFVSARPFNYGSI